MSAFEIDDLSDAEKHLIGRFTYRIFAEMKRFVELGGVLTASKLQEIENTLIDQVTAQWLERSAQAQDQPGGGKR